MTKTLALIFTLLGSSVWASKAPPELPDHVVTPEAPPNFDWYAAPVADCNAVVHPDLVENAWYLQAPPGAEVTLKWAKGEGDRTTVRFEQSQDEEQELQVFVPQTATKAMLEHYPTVTACKLHKLWIGARLQGFSNYDWKAASTGECSGGIVAASVSTGYWVVYGQPGERLIVEIAGHYPSIVKFDTPDQFEKAIAPLLPRQFVSELMHPHVIGCKKFPLRSKITALRYQNEIQPGCSIKNEC